MQSRVETFAEIIDAFGGAAAFGAAIGIPDSHARTMKARDSVSPGWWPRIVTEARARGLAWITYEGLASLAERKTAVGKQSQCGQRKARSNSDGPG
jgi:hypothetical protein